MNWFHNRYEAVLPESKIEPADKHLYYGPFNSFTEARAQLVIELLWKKKRIEEVIKRVRVMPNEHKEVLE